MSDLLLLHDQPNIIKVYINRFEVLPQAMCNLHRRLPNFAHHLKTPGMLLNFFFCFRCFKSVNGNGELFCQSLEQANVSVAKSLLFFSAQYQVSIVGPLKKEGGNNDS